ncbi:predicted protein [Histoplasma mississippiense (nom. inval.)]|uniref:predicted protein n=1 Tax=Ajellomyces capsulatus (strain NAm1 / WU24) TaxID=2059318 RepID=UPI000157CD84|nr:predicted protein [Histoplasma mississippiense (nom. inval.)]EDN10155.1 predicted protein [Histoplasma mississippiense (nom. inval.)]
MESVIREGQTIRRGSIDGGTRVDEARVFCGDLIAQRAPETNRGSCTGSSGIVRTPKLNCMYKGRVGFSRIEAVELALQSFKEVLLVDTIYQKEVGKYPSNGSDLHLRAGPNRVISALPTRKQLSPPLNPFLHSCSVQGS